MSKVHVCIRPAGVPLKSGQVPCAEAEVEFLYVLLIARYAKSNVWTRRTLGLIYFKLGDVYRPGVHISFKSVSVQEVRPVKRPRYLHVVDSSEATRVREKGILSTCPNVVPYVVVVLSCPLRVGWRHTVLRNIGKRERGSHKAVRPARPGWSFVTLEEEPTSVIRRTRERGNNQV